MKIALVCSHGGHLTEILHLIKAFEGNDIFFITYDSPRTRNLAYNKYLFPNFGEAPFKIIFNLPKILSVLKNEKPDIIVSTGAEIAIPFFYLSKLLGIKTMFIETYTRIDLPTITGKLVYPITDRFFILWPELKRHYGKRAEYHGGMFISVQKKENHPHDETGPIFAIVGMHYQGFERLVRQLDHIASVIDTKIIAQIGNTNYKPTNLETMKFLDSDDMNNLIFNSSIVICQGAMSIIDCLLLGKRVIAVPRLYSYGEVMNDHQLTFSMKMRELVAIDVVTDINELEEYIRNRKDIGPNQLTLNNIFVEALNDNLHIK